jgi:hypothetical protein
MTGHPAGSVRNMWLFFSRRLRRWLLLTVAVPIVGGAARRLAARLEDKHGPTPATRALGQVGRFAQTPKQRQRQSAR